MSHQFFTKITGVTHKNADGTPRQDIIEDLEEEWQDSGAVALSLKREPDNPYDPNAVAVLDSEERQLGYLSRQVATTVASAMDRGTRVTALLGDVTGGALTHHYGVNIKILIED